MGEGTQYVLLVGVCFLVPTLLLTRGRLVLLGDDGLLTRLAAHLDRPRELSDEDLADLTAWTVRRTQQLRERIDQLTRVLATDVTMSATRQLANRIAYAQLRRDLLAVPDLGWSYGPADLAVASGTPRTLPGRPEVEVLDVGWSWRG